MRVILTLAIAMTFAFSLHSQTDPILTFDSTMSLTRRRASQPEALRIAELRVTEQRSVFLPASEFQSFPVLSTGYPLGVNGISPSLGGTVVNLALFDLAARAGTRFQERSQRLAFLRSSDYAQGACKSAAIAFLSLASLSRQLSVLGQLEQNAQESERIASERVAAGIAPSRVSLEASLLRAQTRKRVIDVEIEIENSTETLGRLTGIPSSRIKIDESSVPHFVNPNYDPLSDGAVQRSIAVEIARTSEEMARLRAQVLRRQFSPVVNLVGTALTPPPTSKRTLFANPPQTATTLGASIGWILLDPSRLASVKQAEQSAEVATHRARAAEERLQSEVLAWSNKFQESELAVKLRKEEWRMATEDYESVRLKTAGDKPVSPLDLNNVYVKTLLGELAVLEAELQLGISAISLLSLQGEIPSCRIP